MAQLGERRCLDLSNSLTRHTEYLAHLFKGVIGRAANAEPHAQDTLLTWGEFLE